MKIIHKRTFSYFLLLVAFTSITFGCYKRDFDKLKVANATPEYLYPLIDADLSLKDIVDPNKKQLNITEDINGFYTFIYYQDLYTQLITDLLKITDLAITQSVALTTTEVAGLPGSGSISHAFTKSVTLTTTHGERLKTVLVKSGTVPLKISSTFKHNVDATITFPYIKKNGVALTKTISLTYNGASPVVSTTSIDLTGYTLDCSEGNTKFNTITYTGNLKVTYKSGNAITTAQNIAITTGLTDIQYSYVDGYIGQYALSVPKDSVAIDIFDNAFIGTVFFTDPKVRAIITNSVGAESTVKINSLIAQSKITGNTAITGSIINTNIPILYPSLAEIGQSKSTTIQLDKTNSNVQTVFNPAPNKIIYQMSAAINPSGVSANFATDSSYVKIRGEVEIPMEGKVTKFVLLDTIENISYPDIVVGGKAVTITRAAFNVALSNGFPMNTSIQMYFMDDANVILDSLFAAPHVIPSGSIDASGKVTTPTEIFIKEVYDEARYSRITASTKAVMYAYFSTANNGTVPVKIYSSYKLKSNISIDVKANVSF
ncbi:hypothetical protein [Cytophaga aurantiaca]|uniref:hypothetical protein n=1 Tax=Cytophaga aurantiaca TaxID=29530 RepID=UPI001FDECCAD|nr:hypothetical protein [Cytophaga aurantiaca]